MVLSNLITTCQSQWQAAIITVNDTRPMPDQQPLWTNKSKLDILFWKIFDV